MAKQIIPSQTFRGFSVDPSVPVAYSVRNPDKGSVDKRIAYTATQYGEDRAIVESAGAKLPEAFGAPLPRGLDSEIKACQDSGKRTAARAALSRIRGALESAIVAVVKREVGAVQANGLIARDDVTGRDPNRSRAERLAKLASDHALIVRKSDAPIVAPYAAALETARASIGTIALPAAE